MKIELEEIEKEIRSKDSTTYIGREMDVLLSRIKIAEAERQHLSKLLIEERVKVVKLLDAISKHEKFKRTHNNIVALEDEELYQTKKEVETS